MKRTTFLTTALMVGLMVGIAKAETYQVPSSQNGMQSDLLGVSFSSIAFSSAGVLLFGDVSKNVIGSRGGVIVGFIASSYTYNVASPDYIIFRGTGSITAQPETAGGRGGDYSTSDEIFRVYLTSATSQNWVGTQLGTYFMFPKPIRCPQGVVAKCSTMVLNMITYLYQEFGR